MNWRQRNSNRLGFPPREHDALHEAERDTGSAKQLDRVSQGRRADCAAAAFFVVEWYEAHIAQM